MKKASFKIVYAEVLYIYSYIYHMCIYATCIERETVVCIFMVY